MRLLITPLVNLFKLLWALLWLPLRLFGVSGRPEYVRYRLTGDPPYRRTARRKMSFWRKSDPAAVPSLETLRRQVAQLSKDPKVKGVIFAVDGLEVPPAKRDALAAIFQTLRAAGKEVIGYGVSISNAEYELLCETDRILLPAAGRIELTGYAAEVSAIGAALGKAGIGAHFVRRGDYKTAPELFTRDDVSPIQRQTLETLLDERYQGLVEKVARGRKLSVEQTRTLIDEGPYSARRAVARGLADALCSDTDLPNFLAPKDREPEEKGGRPEARVGIFDAYQSTLAWPKIEWRALRPAHRVGVVLVNGMIAEGKGGTLPAGPVVAGSVSVISALKAARNNPRIPAVVLYVSSPGGAAGASEMILDAVKRVAEKKPVVAYFDRVAASGGYMAVCGAKEIWAGQGAIAGSIGVFAGKFDASRLMAKLGIHRELITRGANSGLLTSSRGFTEHELRSLEAEVEETYQSFLEIVAAARSRSKEEVHARGEGRIFSAAHALEQGLIDQVGGFEDACRRALELAGKPAKEQFEIAVFGAKTPRFSLLSLLTSMSRSQLYALWYPWVEVRGTSLGVRRSIDGSP